MAEVKLIISGEDKTGPATKSATSNVHSLDGSVDKLTTRVTKLAGALGTLYIGNKLWEGFTAGINAVDSFQQSVIKTSAMITSLQGGDDIAGNYLKAKQYAEGLQETLMKVDAQTSLNITGLQVVTEEMVKQGVILDNTNAGQVEAFTRLANAAAVYSENGRNEVQLRQEVRALMMGQVDQNSQLASMLQRTVDGPLQQQIAKWKQSGTLIEELGKHLAGFGPANKDIQETWSAVKSSMETTINLLLRAGFGDIVKDIVEQLGKVNDYLKANKDLVGGEIKKGWEELKSLMSTGAEIAKTIYNNFEPFAALFIAGALIKGISGAITLMKELRDVAIATRATMLITGGAGTAAGAAGGIAAGGVLAGGAQLLGAAGLGLGLGYAAQPVVRWADKKIYQNFGVNLTGEAMYNEAQAKDAEAQKRLDEAMARRAAKTSGGQIDVPKVELQDTEDQIKKKIELRDKELAAFKNNQDSMTAFAKLQSEIQLADLKERYDQGSVATRNYYEEEKRIALEAAQAKLDNAREYLAKEQQQLQFIRSKMKGTDNPEYQQELGRNTKAQQAVSEAGLELKKLEITEENKLQEALRARGQEYAKLIAQTLDDSGQYVQAAEARIESERKTIDYLRLQKEALEGVAEAISALASKDKEHEIQRQQAQIKTNEEARSYTEATAKLQDELAALMGKDRDRIQLEAEMRDGRNKLLSLQDRLNLATAQGNVLAITGLQQQIQLQDSLNKQKERQQELSEQVGVLSGAIVGFANGVPTYADSYQKEMAANGYQSPSAALKDQKAVGTNYWGEKIDANGNVINPFNLPRYALGTNFVPNDGPAFLHKGEAVVPKQYNPAAGGSGAGSALTIGTISITLQSTGNAQTDADQLARALVPAITKQLGRSLAA